MRIGNVQVTRIKMPRVDPTWRTASYAGNAVEGFLLQIYADGVTGLGGTAAHPSNISGDELEAQLKGPIRSALLGADPLSGNAIREIILKANVHSRASIAADLALYDVTGKLASLPCYALWGGVVRPRVRVVRMVGIKPPAELETAVGRMVEEGITHFKVKIGTGLQEDVERIRVLRNAFGMRIWIGIDGNGAYQPDQAIELSRALEPYNVGLIEQPIDYRDRDGLARVTAASPIPIIADQCVNDVKSALEICQRRAAHVVSVKSTKMGSLNECRRVFELCQVHGVRVHIGGSAGPSVVDVAMAHLAASLSGIDNECEVGEFQALEGDPTTGARVENGWLELNSESGWGLRLPA